MKKRTLRPYYLIVLAVLLIATVVLVSDNAAPETVVEFQSIEMADSPHSGGGLQAKQPDLKVISEKEDTYSLGNTISSASISKLVDLDYKAYFALVVFQGLEPTGGYGVEIQRITRQGNTVNIYAHFTEPAPAKPSAALLTSPYHLVQIQREGLKGDLVFVVLADGKEILRQTYTVL